MISVVTLWLSVTLVQTPAAQAQAERDFDRARELMKQGRMDEACLLFEKSYELERALGTLLNLATCLEKQGKHARAYQLFTEAAGWSAKSNRPDRQQYSAERLSEIKPKLAWLTVKVQTPKRGMKLSLDGQLFPLSAKPLVLPLDVGEHRAIVKTPDHEDWATDVNASKPGEALSLGVPTLNALVPVDPLSSRELPEGDATLAKASVAPAVNSKGNEISLVKSKASESEPWAATTFYSGSALALAGIVGLVVSNNWYGEFEAQRKENNPAPEDLKYTASDFENLKTLYTVSWVGVGVGLTAAAVGGYFTFFPPSPQKPSVALVPTREGFVMSFHLTF